MYIFIVLSPAKGLSSKKLWFQKLLAGNFFIYKNRPSIKVLKVSSVSSNSIKKYIYIKKKERRIKVALYRYSKKKKNLLDTKKEKEYIRIDIKTNCSDI